MMMVAITNTHTHTYAHTHIRPLFRLDFFVRADAPTSLPLFAVAIVTIMIAAMVTIKPADSNANVIILLQLSFF